MHYRWIIALVAAAICGGCHAAPATSKLATDTPVRWTPPPLSTDQYESSPTLSPDGRELFFFRADRQFDNYRLLYSRCEKSQWSAPVEPAFVAPPGVLEADPAFSPDGRRLYYVSARDRPDDLDIWKVERKSNGQWGQPQRLPDPINSPQTELLPRELTDGRLLFGSTRPGGPGGRCGGGGSGGRLRSHGLRVLRRSRAAHSSFSGRSRRGTLRGAVRSGNETR